MTRYAQAPGIRPGSRLPDGSTYRPPGHETLSAVVDKDHPDSGTTLQADVCQCGEVFTAVSSSPKACQAIIRRKFRSHLRSLA